MTNPCTSCKYAHWYRTIDGKLHPSGGGKCTWEMPDIKIPKFKYWMYNKAPTPSGGHIERKDERNCPAYEPTRKRVKL